jgi:hypothetical protein
MATNLVSLRQQPETQRRRKTGFRSDEYVINTMTTAHKDDGAGYCHPFQSVPYLERLWGTSRN